MSRPRRLERSGSTAAPCSAPCRKHLGPTDCPDDQNCIPLAARVLVIKSGERTILVDAGLGKKWTAKQRQIFAIRNTPGADLPFSPDTVTDVILTHLHFDHAGGILAICGRRQNCGAGLSQGHRLVAARQLRNRPPAEHARASELPARERVCAGKSQSQAPPGWRQRDYPRPLATPYRRPYLRPTVGRAS